MSDGTVVTEPTRAATSDDKAETMDRLVDMTEMLFRQVPPGHLKCGRLTSQAFAPMPKDGRMLSVDRAAKTTAEAAFVAFVSQGRISVGSWGVTVDECSSQGLPCFWDPNPKLADGTSEKNEAHSLIDYRSQKSESQVKKKAACLSSVANQRGCLHRNPAFTDSSPPPPSDPFGPAADDAATGKKEPPF